MDKANNKILVTQPSLPDLEQYNQLLSKIWDSKWLTNNGQFHQEFEQKLADYLGVPYVSLFSNGTLALMVALKALDIQGEVITTPYTFVATAHSLLWNNNMPVFADVDASY
jgi:dTDP-4-amino-4,6-dideoxygalactose transaminase